MKICKNCGDLKALRFFSKNIRMKDGRVNRCCECSKISARKSREKYKELGRKITEEQKVINNNRSRKFKLKNLERVRAQQRKSFLKARYDFTQQEFFELFKKQNFSCAICSSTNLHGKRNMYLDHNHSNGKVRGILCLKCNAGLGQLSDNPQTILKAYRYLIKSLS